MNLLFIIQFGAYVALAFVLFAIQQATHISRRYIPITAIILGILFSWLEDDRVVFNFNIAMRGIQYALYGLGTVATIKYILLGGFPMDDSYDKQDDGATKSKKNKDTSPDD